MPSSHSLFYIFRDDGIPGKDGIEGIDPPLPKLPIPAGTIIEFIANIVKVGNTSMEVEVVGYVEEMYNENRLKAVTGKFTLVAVNENKKPTELNENEILFH